MIETETTPNLNLTVRDELIKASKFHWMHWVIIAASLALTLGVWKYTDFQSNQKLEARFNNQAAQLIELMIERMELYEQALWGGAAYLDVNDGQTSAAHWQRYTNSLNIDKDYPGINGIGVIYNIQESGLAAYLQQHMSERPEYSIHPKHEQDEYWPITYIEPVADNKEAVGLDMAFETNRYTGIKKARDTGLAQLTGPIILVQDDKKTPGFLLFTPFYKKGTRPETIEQRREAIIGATYAPFIMYKLMKGTLSQQKRLVSVKITDAGNLLYQDVADETVSSIDPNPMFMKTVTIEIYGRTWTFDMQSNIQFRNEANLSKNHLILVIGIMLDTMIIILFIFLTRANRKALTYADKITEEIQIQTTELQKTNKDLRKTTFDAQQTAHKLAEQKFALDQHAIVSTTDNKGNITYLNKKFIDISGYSEDELLGKNHRLINSGYHDKQFWKGMYRTLANGNVWHAEICNKAKNGQLYWVDTTVVPFMNSNNKPESYLSIRTDITGHKNANEQILFQSSHDSLTGLVNRREFEARATRLLSTINDAKEEHALCFMDLDQFKIVNDTCGHTAGDELLRQLGKILEKTVRKHDTLARLGGDEFGILMEQCSLKHAHRVATSIQKAIDDFRFAWEGHSFKLGISIGLVSINKATQNLIELLKNADAACYIAKDLGRNRIHIYQDDDSDIAQRHGEMQWVTRLQEALDENKFCLYAQAIMPLGKGDNRHYELLIRMIDKKNKVIPPGAFLPAAERYNLITKIDYWVIEKAFSLLEEHKSFQNQINFISINLSGQSLADASVTDFIIEQLHESDIDAKKICFEITETSAISNLTLAVKFMSTLKELGCKFALDDFGSGLSSFAYLKSLPVDYLKIDGMFVKDIVDGPIDHAMVKSINEIGQVMGMETIAEFVENDEVKGMLREIGVNYAQGYGIHKPLPFEELLKRSTNVTENKTLVSGFATPRK